jgi:AbiV family abortive infection protein
MRELKDVQPIIHACHVAAGKLVDAANAVTKPGSYHIAYHLAALALEEVGKATIVLVDSRLPQPRSKDEEGPSLLKWIDDHERKLFWAIWIPIFYNSSDWKTIPRAMDVARNIHETRINTLYIDPEDLNIPSTITEEQVKGLIDLANICLQMEEAKTFRELTDEEKADLEWFFDASQSPELRPLIFSKGSMEKQADLKGEQGNWIRWLRETFEEMERVNIQLGLDEINRPIPEGEEALGDKFLMTIKLESWSHSIRPGQLKKWNEGIDKIKLLPIKNKNRELLVQFTLPKLFKGKEIYPVGYQNCILFVAALNIATTGFFWWYVPRFVSRYYEKLYDIELKTDLIVERHPPLEAQWGHLAMKEESYNRVGGVWTFLAKCAEYPHKAAFINRYMATLGLMAKNDIFGQFEVMCLVEFMNVFRSGLFAFGDWDGKEDTLEAIIDQIFHRGPNAEEIVLWVKDTIALAKDAAMNRPTVRPITVDEVAKAIVVIDLYVNLKVNEFMPLALAEFKKKAEAAGTDGTAGA